MGWSGPCSRCLSKAILAQRCSSCPVLVLEKVKHTTAAGRLLDRLLDLDFTIKHIPAVSLGPLTVEEVTGLRILQEERDRHTSDSMKKAQMEREAQSRMNEMRMKTPGM